MVRVGIVDYGMGNLHSVAKAISLQKVRVIVSDDKRKLARSNVLVVPGVGSFGAAMTNLSKKKLDDFIRSWLEDGKPYLGICLGLQLLFERSEEDPAVPGLGALKGSVVRFHARDFKNSRFQIPHMGWNTLKLSSRRKPGSRMQASFQIDNLDSGFRRNDRYYFVHSYHPVPTDESVVYTRTPYGKSFCSSVRRSSLFACQFHPEKSGEAGLRLLKNYVQTIGRHSRMSQSGIHGSPTKAFGDDE